jgi:MoaA/NifB/PqqE/SkfB family radical SAM enzyme
MKISTRNINPNFTIVLPGPCQANCDFCFWKREDEEDSFISSLKRSLKKLPKNFSQISISGGEPTLSPVFEKTMKVINKYKKKGKINKIVLTTNGINLLEKDLRGIDHINISRHHMDDITNQEIFKTEKIPSFSDLEKINDYVNKFGIDVNYNVVFNEKNKVSDIAAWEEFVKATGATSITFRNQYGDFNKSLLENKILKDGYLPNVISTCPVCRTASYFIKGIKFKFHSSSYVPTESKAFETNETYELILHPTGDLTRDWEAKKIILKRKKNV